MSVNKVIIIGHLGADPELRYTQSNMPVASLRVATNDRRKGADGNWTDHTEWHSVSTFGKTAENCSQYLKKGRMVYVEGRLQTRKWQDQEGKDRYKTEIVANTVQFLGGGKGSDMQVERVNSSDSETSMANMPMPSVSESVSFDDDDIPF